MYHKDKHWLEKLMAKVGQLVIWHFYAHNIKFDFWPIFVWITSIIKRFSFWKSPNYNVFTMSFQRPARQKPITIRSGNFQMSLQRPDIKLSRWCNTFTFQKFNHNENLKNIDCIRRITLFFKHYSIEISN